MRTRVLAVIAVAVTGMVLPAHRDVDAAVPGAVPRPILANAGSVTGLSNDGHRALVTVEPSGISVVVDSVTNQTFVVPFAGDALLARDGLSVLITTTLSLDPADTDPLSDVYEWFPDTNALLLRTATGSNTYGYFAASMSLDGSVLVTQAFDILANPQFEVMLFDDTTSTVTPMQATLGGGQISDLQLSDDGKRLAYLSGIGSTLSVFDRPTSTIIPIETSCCLGSIGPAFAISGDGTTVAYAVDTIFPTREPADVFFPLPPTNGLTVRRYVVRTVGSTLQRVIGDAPSTNAQIAVNTDATRIAFTAADTYGVPQYVVADLGWPGLQTISANALADADDDVTSVLLSADGTTAAFSTAATNLAATGAGSHGFWRTLAPRTTAGLVAIVPSRLLETRSSQPPTIDGSFSGTGRNEAHGIVALPVAGRGGVPHQATGVMINLTVTEPVAAGFATVYPCGQPLPTASNVNFSAGKTVANNVFTALGGGAVCIYTNVAAHLVVDVNAYALPSSGFEPIAPRRMLDTRTTSAPTVDGKYAGGGRRPAGFVSVFQIAGRGGIDSRGGAYVLNVTAVDPSGAGFLTVYPCSPQRPLASNLNFSAHQTVANTVIVQPGLATFEDSLVPPLPSSPPFPPGFVPPTPVSGNICVFTSAPTDLVVDVDGFIFPRGQYSPSLRQPIDSTFTAVTPSRLLETRTGQPPTVDGLYSDIGFRGSSTVTRLAIVGRAGVPANASSAVLNITSVGSTAAGYVTVYPCDGQRPTTSNLNFTAGQIVANTVVAKIDGGGAVCLFNNGPTDLVVDLGGFVAG
jgi:hypothetical protein